jgi:hypothetical protein
MSRRDALGHCRVAGKQSLPSPRWRLTWIPGRPRVTPDFFLKPDLGDFASGTESNFAQKIDIPLIQMILFTLFPLFIGES